MKKGLPIGINTLEKILNDERIYIDKTNHAYNLIQKKFGFQYVFLSRPRRFGKSLFVDTLKQIFLGKKSLFKDLWIYNSDWDWSSHPVIHIDFSNVEKLNIANLYKDLMHKLEDIAESYNVKIDKYTTISSKFSALIEQLSKINSVVILIDEYDKPILDNIQDAKKAEDIRDLLKSFYEVIKGNDRHVRFLFMTGVTKFNQMGIFSGLNNLKDISFNEKYSTITGYTQDELTTNFDEYISSTIINLKINHDLLLQEIKAWYNGYRFSDSEVSVYNPFSILNFFDEKKFSNYWFATGTPTFLIKLLEKQYPNFENAIRSMNSLDVFNSFDLQRSLITPVLYQSGYLTIKKYDPIRRKYELGYPNFEVEESFTKILESLQDSFTPLDPTTSSVPVFRYQTSNYIVEKSQD